MKLFPSATALTQRTLLSMLACAALTPCHAQDDRPFLQIDPGGHTAVVHQVLFTPDNREMISVGEDKVIRVWDTRTQLQIGTFHGQIGTGGRGKLFAAALSRDGKTLAVAGNTSATTSDGGADFAHTYIWLFHFDNIAQDLRVHPLRPRMSL